MNSARAGTWFPFYERHPDAEWALVCLPHAGGAASFFRSWAGYLPEEIETVAVQYPGRETRRAEAAAEDLSDLAVRIADALAPFTDRRLALFGHSMGAAVAVEVARRLEVTFPGSCQHLFASGQLAPPDRRPDRRHEMDDRELIEDLVQLGGTSSAIMEDPDFQALYLPALRHDYRMLHRHRPTRGVRVSAPVTVYLGTEDPEVSLADVQGWTDMTDAPMTVRCFPGGHFYLIDQRPTLLDDVTRRLTGRTSPRWLSSP
jgi:pyochelin biosynthesis protein PchC